MGTPETITDTPDSSQIDYEKRFKDTQAYATKIAQEKAEKIRELEELKAELSVLRNTAKPTLTIPKEMQDELDDLKFSDPDAWRGRINQLEAEANKEFNSKITEAKNATTQQMVLAERASILTKFQSEHPDIVFTDELLNLDIPLRIVKKLESGKVTYEEFLNEVVNFVRAPKVIGDANKTLNQPNLNKIVGDDTPTINKSKEISLAKAYENMEF